MKFYVSKKVLDLGLKIRFAVINNVNNENNSGVNEFINKTANRLLEEYKDFDIDSDDVLNGFHKIHERATISKRKNTPASENLIRLLKENNSYRSINPLVDIYNLLSIESKLCLGAHDIDKVSGNVTLRFHNGDEIFIPLGDGTSHKVKNNEYSYIDDSNEILCRLEVRQVKKTLVGNDTKNVFYIIEGNDLIPDEVLGSYANKIIEVTTSYLGGEGHIVEYEEIE